MEPPCSYTATGDEPKAKVKREHDEENLDVQEEPKTKVPRLAMDEVFATKFIMPHGYDFDVIYKRAR